MPAKHQILLFNCNEILSKVYTKKQFLYTFLLYIYTRVNEEDNKMGFVISQLSEQNMMSIQSDCEYQMTLIMNTLSRMTSEEATVTQEQMTASQTYLEAHKDEEGVIDQTAIDYVNSDAFNAKWNAKLRQIQAKEQILEQQKQQIETKQKMASNQVDGWNKNKNSNIEKFFKYN